MSNPFLLSGVYYGYPKCCIEEFIQQYESGEYITRGNRKLKGTGYIPCVKCNNLSEAALKHEINSARLHWEPFPKQGPDTYEFVDFSRMVADLYLNSYEVY